MPCRLLDVQELFSDTGVGRQQHVIVGQGQIDAVLNAKPEERRLIIEEAAGILKHRKRKERSERRLAATEGNVLRLGDLLREVRRQLRPLERQAEAARRHGDLVAELRALHVYVAGRELTTLKRRLGDLTAARAELRNEETLLKRRLTELDTAVVTAEARLGALGGSAVGDVLAGLEALREKARGQLALLAERRRGVDRERAAFVDQAVIASLEADSAQLRAELETVDGETEALAPDTEALVEAEAGLADARAAFDREWAGGVPEASGRAAEARGELGALRSALGRSDGDQRRVAVRTAQLRSKLDRVDREAAEAAAEIDAAEAAEPDLMTAAEAAGRRRRAAETAAQAAEQSREAAEADRHAWAARREALELALDEARARAGVERLAAVEGVMGTLLDLVDIDAGWEAAVEAACGEALAAVVLDSVDSGRRALSVLADGDVAGAVLALGAAPAATRATPPTGEPVLAHVRPRRAEVAPLLAGLLAAAVVVEGGWERALDAALAHPDAVVVTRDGGRFGVAGWRIGAAATGATGHALDEARTRAAAGITAAERATADHHAARTALDEARRAEDAAVRRLDHARARRGGGQRRTRTVRGRPRGHRRRTGDAAGAAGRGVRAAGTRSRPRRRAGGVAARARGRGGVVARAGPSHGRGPSPARRAGGRGGGHADRSRQASHRAGRPAGLTCAHGSARWRSVWPARWRRGGRPRPIGASSTPPSWRSTGWRRSSASGTRWWTSGWPQCTRAADARPTPSGRCRRSSMVCAGSARPRSAPWRSYGSAPSAPRSTRPRSACGWSRRSSCAARSSTSSPTPPSGPRRPSCPTASPRRRAVRDLERELRVMGPINPLALEEFEALSERHTFLSEQLDDVKASRRELNKVIRAIDEEIVRVFAAAFADVSENFEQLFATLFPGGQGRLRLTDPDDLLDTGIEVEAKPSGKNVKKLSLLSGGERSLTALAYLFAVFRSRPSPFYVMDEVEAALDDVNLHRFLDLVAEFRQEAQLIIVSHQKRTMEAADCLYGVTMQSGGSSKVVSEKVTVGA